MASLHRCWKMNLSLRSTTSYMGELFQGGRVKPLLLLETLSALYTKFSLVVSASTPDGRSLFRRPYVSSTWSCRSLREYHNASVVYRSNRLTLSPSETLSCVVSIPSIQISFLQSCRHTSREGARKLNGSSVYLVIGRRFGRVTFEEERKTVLKQAVSSSSFTPQDAWEEHWSCDRRFIVKTDGILFPEVPNHKTKKLASLDIRTSIVKGSGRLCVENECIEGLEAEEAFVSEEGGAWDTAYFYCMLPEKTMMRGLFGSQLLLNDHSNAHYLPQSETFVSASEDRITGFTPYLRVGGKESPGVVFDGYGELHYAKDLSSEGVQHGNLRLLSGACTLPHPKKVKSGGEDAYFICSEEQVVGVADGVGGWADVGVDAGDYARELMLQARIAVAQEPQGYIDPARVMFRAHAKTKCRGSSTACILALSDYGLQAANLGDSGFILMRNGRTIFKSSVQQHQFNIPFQLESGGSDPPSAAEVFSLQVSAGDVLVAGTDGLFDNLYDNELIGVIIQSIRAGSDPQDTAQKVVALARERAEDRNRQTPFSTAAQEAGFRFYGGKIDDITVIVSYITTMKSGFLNSLLQR